MTEPNQMEENITIVDVDGYYKTCLNWPSLYVEENGSWREVQQAPMEGIFTVDGKEVGPADCQVVCTETRPFDIPHIEYVEVGEAAYVREPVKGRVKVNFTYYADADCSVEKRYEIIR